MTTTIAEPSRRNAGAEPFYDGPPDDHLVDRHAVFPETTDDEAAERCLATRDCINRVRRIIQQEARAVEAATAGDVSSGDVAVTVPREAD